MQSYPLFDELEILATVKSSLNSEEINSLREKLKSLAETFSSPDHEIEKKVILSLIHHYYLKNDNYTISYSTNIITPYGGRNTVQSRLGNGFIFKIELLPPLLQKIIFTYVERRFSLE